MLANSVEGDGAAVDLDLVETRRLPIATCEHGGRGIVGRIVAGFPVRDERVAGARSAGRTDVLDGRRCGESTNFIQVLLEIHVPVAIEIGLEVGSRIRV